MPINRYQIRNVYSLADQELYKGADKDDPEALLEGVAMAGLAGVLRQLGDLAEFAAEIFHELHEEVTETAARGHGLLVRAQQLELEIPSIQRSFMSQTCHSAFFTNSGVDWHPNLQTTPNLITTGDLPRFVMNSYEECRGPPRLFLLDKFDVGGAGACLKRYTDPSFYKVEVSSYEIENSETQRDKKIRKNKKKGSQWKGGGAPEISPNSKAKLHQLFMEDNGTIEPTHRVKLKKRPNKSPFNSESYINKLLSSPSKGKIVHPVPFHPSIIPVPFDSPNQSGFEIFKDSIGSPFNLATPSRSPSVSSSVENTGCQIPADNLAGKVTDEEIKTDGVQNGCRSDDVASEMDNYVDALATMESQESFSDQFSDSQIRPRVPLEEIPGISCGASIDANQGVVLEEGSETEVDENLKNEEHQIDFHSPAGSLLSFQFFGNFEGEVENEHPNDGSSPMIHVPNILETTDKISEENHSTEDDSVSVVEETLDSCEKCSLPEEKLKEIGDGDDVLHIFDSAEAKVLYFSEDEKELNRSEIETATPAVSDLDDADKIGEIKERETGLVNSESTPVSVPYDVDTNDDKSLLTLEDDTELEKSFVVLLPLDVDTNENNARDASLAASHHDLNDEVDRNDDNALSALEDDTSFERKKGEEDSVNLVETKKSASDLDDDDVDRNDDNTLSTHEDDNPYFLHDFGSQPIMTVTEKPPMLELPPPPQVEDKDDPQLLFASAGSRFSSQSDSPTHEEDPQPKPITVSVPVSVPDKPPALELLQTNGHDIDLVDQVNHQLPPVFPAISILPGTPPPVKLEDTPPLPPLPPMQWRTRKLQSRLLTPTNGGQHSDDDNFFTPVSQSKVDEIKNTETGNENFENEGSFSLHAQDHDKKSAPTEAKLAENLVPKEADEMLNNIRPMKIQRPRAPLIDAIATHDKAKLRKVLAMSQITKGQENDKLLEQIRTKSYNLKPAAQTRPNIQGPTTNVRIAAILEKANAIRQAFAGSDEDDDDSDSWSDS